VDGAGRDTNMLAESIQRATPAATRVPYVARVPEIGIRRRCCRLLTTVAGSRPPALSCVPAPENWLENKAP